MIKYFEKHRKVGWIELFFDLAFVVFIGTVAHTLFHGHHGVYTQEQIFSFVFLSFIMMFVWMQYTQFMNYYEDSSNTIVVFTFAAMMGLLTIGMLIHDIYLYADYIAIISTAIFFVLGILYKIYKNKIPENYIYANYKFIANASIFLLSLLSLLMDDVVTIVFIMILLSIERIIDHLFQTKYPSMEVHKHHIVERIGIFTILLIGESFITLFNDVETATASMSLLLKLLVIIFSVYIAFFTYLDDLVDSKFSKTGSFLLSYGFVFFAFIVLPVIIQNSLHPTINVLVFKLLVTTFITFYMGGTMLLFSSISDKRRRRAGLLTAVMLIPTLSSIWTASSISQLVNVLFYFQVVSIIVSLAFKGRVLD